MEKISIELDKYDLEHIILAMEHWNRYRRRNRQCEFTEVIYIARKAIDTLEGKPEPKTL